MEYNTVSDTPSKLHINKNEESMLDQLIADGWSKKSMDIATKWGCYARTDTKKKDILRSCINPFTHVNNYKSWKRAVEDWFFTCSLCKKKIDKCECEGSITPHNGIPYRDIFSYGRGDPNKNYKSLKKYYFNK